MHKVFITGSSLICALGNNKMEAINNFQIIDEKNYKEYLKNNFEDINYYKIKKEFKDEEDKFYSSILQVIKEAINEAKLSKGEEKELHIFLATTSMNISLLENELLNENSIDYFGYKKVLDFIEKNINSKYPATIIQTACTSSANAIIKASEQIKNSQIKKALIIGFEFFNYSTFKGFESLMLLSQSGEYKPFDKNSDGLILGEACSAIILENSQKTKEDFQIIGNYTSFDNYSITSSNPSGESTLQCFKNALKSANLELKDIDFIKAHATGSENSNFSEATAINRLFYENKKLCDVVILKPYIGHTLGSCGTNEIIILCEAIKNGLIPKTINFKSTYENIYFKPLLEDKKINKATTLFHFVGFGGSNASIIISNKGL
ncbi:beta-ketoacyl synthase N-terminal-like domain-containing protein [Aliarcobacter lanthieri]|uniref:beta-ketoacyl synthase N-terminal-like domain-containing protein n=1 Tax=Aliarcobacter lanthieri TaxID=1355374 RepID=UPI003AFA6B22